MNQELQPIAYMNGNLVLPSSKSISNRMLLLASLVPYPVVIHNVLYAEDTLYLFNALKQLGVEIEKRHSTVIIKNSISLSNDVDKVITLNLHNAGTGLRPLCAILSFLGQGCFILTGNQRMQQRPILHLVDALVTLGASIEYLGDIGYPPIKIRSTTMHQFEVTIDGSLSSQYVSALLMLSPIISRSLTIKIKNKLVSRPYIDMTLSILKLFKMNIIHDSYQSFYVEYSESKSLLEKLEYTVEGDASSASYFFAASAIRSRQVKVYGLNRYSIQGDIGFLSVLEKMGASVAYYNDHIIVKQSTLTGIDIDMNDMPDVAMTLAVLAVFAKGKTVIRNIYNWKIKESDRLVAMYNELRKVGAVVSIGDDFIMIEPPKKFLPAVINTYNDHRMAMCFSLMAFSGQVITITGSECVNKTYPSFFNDWRALSSF